ncbi:MAG: antitoxin Xre/MbcA/ParS toxin-binding domain-containing protein [Acidobacteriota bacterium]
MATPAKSLPKPLTLTLRLDLAHIESGVPTATMTDFVTSSGIPLKDIYDVVIPARTLKHRRARKEPLSRDESDKLARLARIFDHAVRVFDGRDRARFWLEEPKPRFGDRTPLAMLATETGGRLVEQFLGQIEFGMFA